MVSVYPGLNHSSSSIRPSGIEGWRFEYRKSRTGSRLILSLTLSFCFEFSVAVAEI